jgi:peptidoglycan/LPS O-acetylase OafA/YrhL
VVAALGSEGVAVRDADGTWRRMGFSSEGFSVEDATPLSSPEIDLAPERFWGFFAGLFTFMAGIVAARHRRRPSGRVLAATAYTLVVIGVVLAALDGRDTLLPNLMFLTGSICALLGALLALVAAVRARLGSRSPRSRSGVSSPAGPTDSPITM